MSEETVYILGAGFNQCVEDWNGIRPPLINDFFQKVILSKKYTTPYYSKSVSCVYEYIQKYWKRTKDNLLNQPFNLEEFFTMIQLQTFEALKDKNKDRAIKLLNISVRLTTMLAELLSEFELFGHKSDLLKAFGEKVYSEKSTILTFNYDCILETAIESASKVNTKAPKSFIRNNSSNRSGVSDEELAYSHYNWNRPLGYGIKFDEIQLQRAGLRTIVNGQRFYKHPKNNLYRWKILKLHGSLNWFQYWPIRKYPNLPGKQESPKKETDLVLVNATWWQNELPDINGWVIHPLIITPVLYKDKFYEVRPFPEIWKQAKSHLRKCKRLIIIGYSFSVTDFSVKKLLLEAFETNKLEELIVVNPSTKVVKVIKEIVNFDKPVLVCQNLEEFLKI